MGKFLLHTTALIALVAALAWYAAYQASGRADANYAKVSSSVQRNLILGTSKAAQGLNPYALKKYTNIEFYNFAFSVFASPYGPDYTNCILRKLDTTVTRQTFLLAIDPWSLTVQREVGKNPLKFRERNGFLTRGAQVTGTPNFSYLLHHYESKYYKLFFPDSLIRVHDNGWLQVNLDLSKEGIERRTSFTLDSYLKKAREQVISHTRLTGLIELVSTLKKYGKVYLIRLPVHPELYQLEDRLSPHFNSLVNPAVSLADGYLDFSGENHNYDYTDGVHLTFYENERIAEAIASMLNTIP